MDSQSRIEKIFEEIAAFNSYPSIFRMCLTKNPFWGYYEATISFYQVYPGEINPISVKDNTPEEAMERALEALKKRIVYCPNCKQIIIDAQKGENHV